MEPADDDAETMIATRQQMLGLLPGHQELLHYLVVLVEDRVIGTHLLGAKPLAIGRDATRDVVLDDPEVSRLHLNIFVAGSRVVAQDLGSSNGTFLDGERLSGPTTLEEGRWLDVGRHKLRHERRTAAEAEAADSVRKDLEKARAYVEQLMPPPVKTGPVHTDWCYRPSAHLGGDAFSYGRLDDDHVVAYLLDVSGHGVHAAMHAVSVVNVLRQRALPAADFLDPASVLVSLNAMFPMEAHDGMYFTIWYGVYSASERRMAYASAGHHASMLCAPGAPMQALRTNGPMIGAMPEYRYRSASVEIAAGSALYLFSDGVFEVTSAHGRVGTLEEFADLLEGADAQPDGEAERAWRAVRSRAKSGTLDDDFTLLIARFQ